MGSKGAGVGHKRRAASEGAGEGCPHVAAKAVVGLPVREVCGRPVAEGGGLAGKALERIGGAGEGVVGHQHVLGQRVGQ